MVLICPIHHQASYHIDASFDFVSGGFLIGSELEKLKVIRYELAA